MYVANCTRECTRCCETKDISMFSKNRNSLNGVLRQCKACKSKIDREYREKNKKKLSEINKKNYLENRELYRERNRVNYIKNIDARKAYSKDYAIKNRDWLNIYKREWQKANPEKHRASIEKGRDRHREYIAAWRKTDHGKAIIRNINNKRRSAKKITDLTGPYIKAMIDDVSHCPLCENELNKTDHRSSYYPHLDHIIPLCLGGDHMMYNVRIICAICNMRRPNDGSDI